MHGWTLGPWESLGSWRDARRYWLKGHDRELAVVVGVQGWRAWRPGGQKPFDGHERVSLSAESIAAASAMTEAEGAPYIAALREHVDRRWWAR